MLIDIQETRRQNLIRVMESLGYKKTDLAKKTERSDQQIGKLINGKVAFGKNIARSIEKSLGLSENTLDIVSNTEQVEAQTKYKRIPLVSFAQAGLPTETGDISYDETIEVIQAVPDESYATRVKGDSMEPAFSDGDIIVVDVTKSPRAGSYVVARLTTEDGRYETLFKQYAIVGIDNYGREIFELRPLNNIYPTLRSDTLNISIIGVVVECRKTFR